MTFKRSLSAPRPANAVAAFLPPPQLGWPEAYNPLAFREGVEFASGLDPRSLVDPAIWTGAAFHVDPDAGNDGNSGAGAHDGDFSDALRTVHAAFTAGNATGAAYRVILKPALFSGSAFSQNGNVEPDQPVAILGHGGVATYRAGEETVTWSAGSGGDFSASVSGVRRAFNTAVEVNGRPQELTAAASLGECETTPGTFYQNGGAIHVNVDGAPAADQVILIRAYHGARFLNHTGDIYLENLRLQGGISGALHCDAISTRNVVGRNCVFEMSAPSASSPVPDAVAVRRVRGLVAFFDCRADQGAKDGWNFHADDQPGMHVLLSRCSGRLNGTALETSCNALTLHDDVKGIALGGDFGFSINGTEVHIIQDSRLWALGSRAQARDPDNSSTGFKCSNKAAMWLEHTSADCQGGGTNTGIEANGGAVFTRQHQNLFCGNASSSGGVVATY